MKTTERPGAAPGGRLERSQEARRARVLDVVLDLAREGGYDAIQLRPVAERSGISTDTIYRYFGSRERLIAAAVREWNDREFSRPAPSWFRGDTPVERLLSYYRRLWQVWERHPTMLETTVRAAFGEREADDGIAARLVSDLEPLTADALGDVDAAYRADVLMIVEHVTHSAMTFVVRDKLRVDEVFPLIERTLRRLAEHPAMAAVRPTSWEWHATADVGETN
jgi:TetR/AcrR family transcriptional regulator, cholesterol catabolism regulator